MTREAEKTNRMLVAEVVVGMPIQKYLRNEYVKNQKTQGEIASDLGISQTLVGDWLKNFGINARSYRESSKLEGNRIRRQFTEEIEDEIGEPIRKYLRREYEDNGRPKREIASELGVSLPALDKMFDDLNIKTRPAGGGSRRRGSKTLHMIDAERRLGEPIDKYVRREYLEKSIELKKIAKKLRVTPNCLGRWMDDWGIKRRTNPFRDIDYCLKVARKIKREHRLKELHGGPWLVKHGHGSLYRAINRQHGGLIAFRKKLGENPTEYRYFHSMSDRKIIEYTREHYQGKTLSQVQREDMSLYSRLGERRLRDKVVSKGILVRTRRKALPREISKQGLIRLAKKEFKGMTIREAEEHYPSLLSKLRQTKALEDLVSEGVIERISERAGYFKSMTDRQLIAYIESHYHGKTITEAEKGGDSGNAVIMHARKRGLVDKLVEKGILIRKQHAPDRFGGMSDRKFMEYIAENHSGKTLTDVHAEEQIAYRELKKRKLDDSLVEKGILIRKEKHRKGLFRDMSDRELINYFKEHFSGRSINSFQDQNQRPYVIARERGLVPRLIKQGVLVKKRHGYSSMSDEEIRRLLRYQYRGVELMDIKRALPRLYDIARQRGIIRELVDGGVILRARTRFYGMSDEEILQFIGENHKGKTMADLKRVDGSLYRAIQTRGLVDAAVSEGSLNRATRPSQRNKDYAAFIGSDNAAQSIASLASVSDDTSKIAELLVKQWPDRFPSAADLARSLPGAVKRIGYSLTPFTMEKAREVYDKTKSLPLPMKYALDDLLYGIAVDQYQMAFDRDPESTIEELREFARQKNGVKGLAKKVLDYYSEVYQFSIPGQGNLRRSA